MVSFESAGISDYKHLVFIDGFEGKNSNLSLDSYSYPNLEFHISEVNVGKSAAFNIMFSMSDCRYLFFLDSDDIFLPSKISQQYSYLQSHDVILGANYFSYLQSSPSSFLISEYPCDDYSIRSSFVFFHFYFLAVFLAVFLHWQIFR